MRNLGLEGAWRHSNWMLAASALALLGCAILTGRPSSNPHSAAGVAPRNSPVVAHEVAANYGKLPIAFEENRGQSDPRVKFLAHGSRGMLFLTADGAVLRLQAPPKPQPPSLDAKPGQESAANSSESAVVRLTLAGANPRAAVAGVDQQPGHSNYFIGRDRAHWHTNVPQFARVHYSAVYPGVDMTYYGHDGLLESDFVLAPGADANQINLHIAGARKLTPDAQGNLVLSTSAGNITLARPVAYQEIDGNRQLVAARYVLRGSRTAGIELGAYDRAQQLVVDPVIGYSTLLGGSGADSANGIAVDANGNVYIAGYTGSSDFPVTAGAYQSTLNPGGLGNDAFVAELNQSGSAVVFATYFGGSGTDIAYGIGIDAGANAYIAGTTTSFDLPTAATAGSPIASQFPSGNTGTTGFFAEFSSAGTVLSYSTYLGGNERDTPSGIFVDASGNAYVVGTTTSTNFPLSTVYGNAFQTFSNAVANGGSAAFLSKISTSSSLPGLQGLLYSTYLGGSDNDGATAVAADAQGNAYITGTASSTDFPITSGAFQTSISLGDNVAYITRLDTTKAGNAGLIYSSYLGGTGTQGGVGRAIAADSNFNAYVGGGTSVANFPVTPNAFMTTQPAAGYIMGFVARFNTNATSNSLVYSTYLGGSNVSGNFVYGIAADGAGDAYVTGSTYTNNYPTTPGAPQLARTGVSNSILTVVNPAGTGLLFSSYWGGASNDQGNAVTLDTASPPNVYFAGQTTSGSFPTTSGVFQTNLKGPSDAFVAKFSPGAAQGVFVSPTTLAFGNQGINSTSQSQPVTLTNNVNATLSSIAITFTGTNAGDFGQTDTCGTSLAAFQSCTINVTFTPTISGAESATLNIADSATGSPQTVTLTGTGTAISVSPSSLTFGSQPENTTSPAQTVTVTNNGTSTLTINSITATGANGGDFGVTNGCSATLATGANCTVSVTFTPTTQSAESAALQVADTDPSSPQTVALSGTGTHPATGVTLSPTSLSFGNQSQGTASPSQPVTLTNTGTAALTITSIASTGANAADFSQTNTCPSSGSTLAAGTSCTINVTFTPSTQAAESASITITDSDPTSPQSVPLTGTGTAPVTAFSVTVNPTSATVAAGQAIAFGATVTSENGFNSPVSFVFAGCPGDTSCTASPNPVTPPANGTASSTITIQTNLQPSGAGSTFHYPNFSGRPLWLWTLLAIACAFSIFWGIRRRGVKRFACAFAMILLIGLASCSGAPSTPKGTYKVTIQGTSGGQSFPVTFTLTVN